MAVMTFISSLPIRKIGGIGKVTEHVLKDVFGVTTSEEMLQKSSFLCALFSRSSSDFFLSVGLGLGRTDTPQVKLRKSISSERTFSATEDETLLYQKLVDLAEMLSADMEKEGLSGRTLTLKLKTASFEVRTRAVTLEKYVCSSKDILKYASKLLKAELPVCLRLIGLRMSQFNEDKDGSPSDPTQKTLSKFFISGDTSGRNMSDDVSVGSDISDNHFMMDTENGLSTDLQEACHGDFRDSLDNNQISSFNHGNCLLGSDSCDMEKSYGPLSNQCKDKFEGINQDQVKKRANLSDEEVVPSLNEKEPFLWVNDYKCSLCGIELPPSFVEERQEHSDFHFAQRLQEEESSNSPSNLVLKQRFTQKHHIASGSRRKKHKSSDGNHLPIDVFFAKSNQNF